MAARNTKLGCKFLTVACGLAVRGTNLINLGPRKFSHGVSFTDKRPFSVLGNHVGHILGVGSNPKVFRSYASAHVAPMANLHSFRHWSKMQNPTGYVSPYHLHSLSAELSSYGAISTRKTQSFTTGGTGPNPNPTGAKFWTMFLNWSALINLTPKPFWKGWGQSLRGKVLRGNLDAFNIHRMLSHALGCSFTARAFSL